MPKERWSKQVKIDRFQSKSSNATLTQIREGNFSLELGISHLTSIFVCSANIQAILAELKDGN